MNDNAAPSSAALPDAGALHRQRRLIASLVASCCLHLIVLVGFSPTHLPLHQRAPVLPKPPLQVRLAITPPGNAGPQPAFDVKTEAVPQPPAPPRDENAPTSATAPPRFITEPELVALEQIPVIAPGSVRLRLRVSTLGTVDQVDIVRNDPAPPELLEGLIDNIKRTALRPAMRDGKAVPSELEITVNFEPVHIDRTD